VAQWLVRVQVARPVHCLMSDDEMLAGLKMRYFPPKDILPAGLQVDPGIH